MKVVACIEYQVAIDKILAHLRTKEQKAPAPPLLMLMPPPRAPPPPPRPVPAQMDTVPT